MANISNLATSAPLDDAKAAIEAQLRADFSSLTRAELKAHPMLHPYTEYYRRYGKTYHVQHQLESIVFKGKSIPMVAPLVEAMFMAELRNLLLTAGHDLDSIEGLLGLDLATGSETYTTLGGQEQTLKQDDMFIQDEQGVLSSILYGPDLRTRIRPETTRLLFTVYAPVGIPEDRLRTHLTDLKDFVSLVSSEATLELTQIIQAKALC